MTITNSLSKIIPGEAVRRIFIEGFARGALWAGVLTTIAILPVFLISQSTSLSFDEFARAVVALAISAAGGFVSLSSETGGVVGGAMFFEVGLRPTLITLLVGLIAYRAGSRVKEFRSEEVSLKVVSAFSALGLGLGFVSAFFALSTLSQGSLDSVPGLAFEPLGLKSILWIFFVVAIPCWLGSMSYVGRKSASSWKWAFASVRTFAFLYGVVIAIAGTVFLVSQWISPDWGLSSPELPPMQLPKFEWSQVGIIAAVILAFLIVLPAILFTVLAIGAGGNLAVQFDFLGSDVLGAISSVIPGIDLSSITNLSVASTLGSWPFVLVLVALVVVSMISGAKASGQFGSDRGFAREFLKVGVVSLFLGLVARSVSEIYLAQTNLGKPSHLVRDGELVLQEGFISIGITSVSLALIAVAVAVFLAAGATFARTFVSDAFPRLSAGPLKKADGEQRNVVAQIFGAVTSLAVFAAVLIPISAPSIERVWGLADGPGLLFEDIAKTIEGEDIQKTKLLFGFKESEAQNWLPDEVLSVAKPTASARQPIEVGNSRGGNWEVGNTDAKTTVVWKSDDGEVKLPLVAEAKVVEKFPLVKHPEFKSKPASVEIRFSTGPALQTAGQTEVSVNGTSTANGTYKALPGSYELVVPGFKLIAPSTQRFFTSGESLSFISQEVILLTQEQESIMDKAFADLAQECANQQDVTKLNCADFSEIYEYRTTESGFEAGEYFALESSNYKVLDSKCSENLSDEVKAVDVTFRTKKCSLTVKFDVEYFDSKLQKKAIFQTQRYNGCPQVAFAFCERFRQVRVGTAETEVKNKSLGKAQLVSTIPFELSLFGVLDNKGDFTARDTWIAPKPIVEPAPEEPKEPEEPKQIKLLGRYETKQDMEKANPSPRLGDGYVVGSGLTLWVWNGRSWIEIGER